MAIDVVPVTKLTESEPLVVLGLMSGTSVDALDVAMVEVRERGDSLHARVLAYDEVPFEDELRTRLLPLFDRARGQISELCEINFLLGEAFSRAAAEVVQRSGVAPDLVASHGQTMWHESREGRTRSTLQIGEPSIIAERLGITVVADFRPRDIAAGGHGAPLSSWADAILFSHRTLARAVQNIGGIANVTWLPPGGDWDRIIAFDTGPGNVLLDQVVWRLSGGTQRFDTGGAQARQGNPDRAILAKYLAHPYFQQPPPKTTGRELFGADFAEAAIQDARARGLNDFDIVRTLTDFTADSIADQYRQFLPIPPTEVIVGGGGVHNPVLMELLSKALEPARVVTHERFGLKSAAREAVYFALLGYETLHGRANSIAAATGARHGAVLGKLVPGANYSSLMDRVRAYPKRHIRHLVLE